MMMMMMMMMINAQSVQTLPRHRLGLYTSLGAYQARAYPGFRSMKRLGVLLLPPGWDASPSQCLAQEHNAVPRPGLELGPPDPESSALTIRPPRLPRHNHAFKMLLIVIIF